MAIQNIILKGISRVPDDSASGGGELQAAVNLANDGAGLKLIEKPAVVFTLVSGEECVFIHQTSEYKHYIIVLTEGDTKRLVWVDSTELGEDPVPRHDMYSDTTTDPKTLYYLNGELKTISAIGNTLCIADGDGLGYVLYKDTNYLFLGQKPPFVDITFGLESEFMAYPSKDSEGNIGQPITISLSGSTDDIPIPTYSDTNSFVPPKAYVKDDWKQYITYSMKDKVSTNGDTSKNSFVKDLTENLFSYLNRFVEDYGTDDNKFIMPFFVRYAYELYDGSNIMHSYPVLMIPNSKGPVFGLNSATSDNCYPNKVWDDIAQEYFGDYPDYGYAGFEFDYDGGGSWDCTFRGRIYSFVSKLLYSIESVDSKLSDWKDIVNGINIYVTAPTFTYDQSGYVYGWQNMDSDDTTALSIWRNYWTIGRITNEVVESTDKDEFKKRLWHMAFTNLNKYRDSTKYGHAYFYSYDENYYLPSYILTLPMRTTTEIRDLLVNSAQFYKIYSIEFDDLVKPGFSKSNEEVPIEDSALSTLTNREQMEDDYHTHDKYFTDCGYTYNRRYNMGGATRLLHSPIDAKVQWQKFESSQIGGDATAENIQVAVYVRGSVGNEEIVISDDSYSGCFPLYIFYPNSDAYKAVVKFGDTNYTVKLKQHPLLEGAYWISNIYYADAPDTVTSFPSSETEKIFIEKGKVFTSNVDNPFKFSASNINTIGDGEIRALCANVQPVNAYNFGLATMYAFTSEGVWGLKVNDTGGWSSVQPITRDVITEGTKPLPLGQNIVFLSNRGVLRIDINSSLTKLMSHEIEGNVDGNFLHIDAVLASVFGDELAEKLKFGITQASSSEYFWHDGETKMAYDYRHSRLMFSNSNAGCWVYNLKSDTWTQAQTHIDGVLNSWPECEFVQDGEVVTMDGEQSRYESGLLLTRPILTGGEWFSRLKQVVTRGHFDPHASDVQLALFGGRNWHDYALVATSQMPKITRHYGSGFKSHAILAAVNTTEQDLLTLDRIVLDIEGSEVDKLR